MKPLNLKYCKCCGEAFETLNPEQMFCSNKCANKFNRLRFKSERAKISKTCKYCGKEFETSIPEQTFCSTKCSSKYNYEIFKVEKVCPVCHKRFVGGISQKYCSKECCNVATKYKRKHKDKICPVCGKSFKGNNRKKYCSKKCANSVVYYHRKGKSKDTLCWDCQNACCGCSWSRTFTPVKGWVTEPAVITYKTKSGEVHTTDSYKVIECPEFKGDDIR